MLFQYCIDVDIINRVDIVEKMLLQGRNDIDTTISKRVHSFELDSIPNKHRTINVLSKNGKKKIKKRFYVS